MRRKNNNRIFYKILNILEKKPNTRNSDEALCLHVWWNEKKDDFVQLPFMTIKKTYFSCDAFTDNFISYKTIWRIRAMIQNDLGMYMPSEVIRKKRRMRKEFWELNIANYKNITFEEKKKLLGIFLKETPEKRVKIKDNINNILINNKK